MYVIDRLSITSGNTTTYFQASSTFPIYISWLWCTLVMYTMICLVVVCSCYHGLAINSLYSIYYEPIICQLSLLLEPIFCVLVPDYINARTILQHTWALSSESSDSTQVFTGACWRTLQKIKNFPMVSPRSIYEFI